MTRKMLMLMLSLFSTLVFGQQKEEAEKLVDEGVAYHNKGDYEVALAKYENALKLDKDNQKALVEKAYTLNALGKFEDAVSVCKDVIQKHPGGDYLPALYVTYAVSLEAMHKINESLEAYEEGIKQFPDEHQLYFNKGVTLIGITEYDYGMFCLQKSLLINPNHAGSCNVMARLLQIQEKKIPAVLAYCRFLVIDPQSERAKENLDNLQTIMKGNVEKTGKNEFNILVDVNSLSDSIDEGMVKENSFHKLDVMLSLDAALDHIEDNRKKSEVIQFVRKFDTICAVLKESKSINFGFYWDFYAPYFIEMRDKKFLETFAYIAFASSEDPDVMKWLREHESEINQFYDWSTNYPWPSR